MASVLLIGARRESALELFDRILAAGHRASFATSRREALGSICAGSVDAIALDAPLHPEEEAAAFATLMRALPELPTLFPRDLVPPVAGTAPEGRAREPIPASEGLSRAVSYLFGLAEGRRIAVSADLEPLVPRPPRMRALATEARNRTILFEWIERADSGPRTSAALRILGRSEPILARARLRFPGRGTLTVRGVTRVVSRFEGAPASLLLTYAPSGASAGVEFERAESALALV
ncbi:MAG: hypothetical protein L0216_09805 [Planctomycetales bacterium]|nr:hypothetical protein [Planctomycetales bacterium]